MSSNGFLRQSSTLWERRPLPASSRRSLRKRWAALLGRPVEDGAVLVCGSSWDSQAYAVATGLRRRGVPCTVLLTDDPHVRGACDPYQYSIAQTHPFRSAFLRLTSADGVPFWPDRVLFVEPELLSLSDTTQAYVQAEKVVAEAGWVSSLDCDLLVNDPLASANAHKPRQLRLARQLGLSVPATLVSRSLREVAVFFDRPETPIVFKPLGALVLDKNDSSARIVTPTEMRISDLSEFEPDLPTPGLFQERLPARREWRAVVVGDRVLAAAVERTPDDAIDWRRAEGVMGAVAQRILPDPEKEAIVRLVRALGLEYAAVDLVETDRGLFFLEANPDGTFWWLERLTGLPIADALCRRLLSDQEGT